ncbi:nuclear transport factor 2 family protein [Streptomyces sp. NPDC003635]
MSTAAPADSGPVPRNELLDPVAAYVRAVAAQNLDALVAAFAPDAEVIDVGRSFSGRDAIRGWADREVIGGALSVDAVVESRAGYQKLLVTFAPGGGEGFAAHYAFTVSGSAVTRADLTYADRPSREDRS